MRSRAFSASAEEAPSYVNLGLGPEPPRIWRRMRRAQCRRQSVSHLLRSVGRSGISFLFSLGVIMRSILCSFAILAIVVAAESSAVAQSYRAMYNPSAAGNLGGARYRPYTARTYSGHAINHAQTLQHYAKSGVAVPQDTAQEHAAEVRRNIDAFGKEVAKLPQEFEKDSEAKKLIDEIREHQAAAAKHCGMLEAECAKHLADGGTVAKCCDDMLKHLRAADAAHDKLMKHLGIAMPGQAAKKPAKSDEKK